MKLTGSAPTFEVVKASKVWYPQSRSQSRDKKLKKAVVHNGDSIDYAALDLKAKIDGTMRRCQSDVDQHIKDFLRLYNSSSRATFSKSQPSAPDVPVHPLFHPSAVPEMSMMSSGAFDSPTNHEASRMMTGESQLSGSHISAGKTEKKVKRVPLEHVKVNRSQSETRPLPKPEHDGARHMGQIPSTPQLQGAAQPEGASYPVIASPTAPPQKVNEMELPYGGRNMRNVPTFSDMGFGTGYTSPRRNLEGTDSAVSDVDEDSHEDAEGGSSNAVGNLFSSVEDLKSKVQAHVIGEKKEFDPVDLLHDKGLFRTIALHPVFEYLTLFFISINAIWMGYDTDMNQSSTLLDAKIQFIIMENVFCVYFLFEWIVRFFAFKYKCLFYKDGWFVFDSCLMLSMILETWVLTLIAALIDVDFGGLQDILGLVRLTRLARMARLLRALPDLLIMVKAIIVSMKTVIYALILLFVMVYVFSIAFTQLMAGANKPAGTVAHDYFRTVPVSMNTLLLSGALPDQAGLIDDMQAESPLYYLLMLAFLFFASLTVMNMLIGILCDVISDVSDGEKESMLISRATQDLESLMKALGIWDDAGYLSRARFEGLLLNRKAKQVFEKLGVDIFALVEFADIIFPKSKRSIPFTEFMERVLELRGTNTATVKDIIELRKLVVKEIDDQSRKQNNTMSVMNRQLNELTGRSPADRRKSAGGSRASELGDMGS